MRWNFTAIKTYKVAKVGLEGSALLRRPQSGFTLIELMIVVGIIGILVAIAGPKFEKYQSKAKQSEAKLSLSSIYSLQQSFYAEYGAYMPSFDAIGFSVEGERRWYRVGWSGGAGDYYAGTVNGYSGSLGGVYLAEHNLPADFMSSCGLNNAPLVTPMPTEAPFNVDNPQSFVAGAVGRLRVAGAAPCDQWRINNLKSLQNVQIGL